MPIDYQNAKVYTIVNTVNDSVYVGSSTQKTLALRMGQHRSAVTNLKKTSDLYAAMRTLGVDQFRIVLHHVFPCNSKDELEAEEYKTLQTYIDAGTTTYNMRVAGNKANAALKQKLHALQREIAHDSKNFTFGGVAYQEGKNGSKRWKFQWNEVGVGHSKGFSVKKFGYWQAKLLAEAERRKVYPEWKSDEECVLDEFANIEL